MAHPNYLSRAKETIGAVATPPGNGGIAIIRVSGSDALDQSKKIIDRPPLTVESHKATLVTVLSKEGKPLDQALMIPFIAPRSFTGEDTVEFHCHGGHLIAREVLEALIQKGVRMALPGEFTFRAFLNGKIDLTQAEAIQDLIGAHNEKALSVAEAQLEGRLGKEIKDMQNEVTRFAAIFEAWVDFPEEGLEFDSMEHVLQELKALDLKIDALLSTYHEGKIIHDGISICLLGSPNVGKSSLMNALLGKDRAIVSHIPGTTRDTIEESLRLEGVHCRLVDTAGIRETSETIEEEGVHRSRKALKTADIVFIIGDASRPDESNGEALLKEAAHCPVCFVWNKIDLISSVDALPKYTAQETVYVSAKTGHGIKELKKAVHRLLFHDKPSHRDEMLITNSRHKDALVQAKDSLGKVIKGLEEGVSPEFITFDMRETLTHLGEIIGTDITEDILTQIFSQFCIGK